MKHLFACFLVALLAVLCPYFFEWDYMTAKADDYISGSVDYANPDEVFTALCEYYHVNPDDYYYYYCPSYLSGGYNEGVAWCMIIRHKTNPYYAQSLDVYAYNSSDEKITYYMQGDYGCFFTENQGFGTMTGVVQPSWGSRSNVSDYGATKIDLPVQVYSNVNSIEGYRNTTSCPDDMTFKLFGSDSSEYSDVKSTTGLMLSYFSQFGFNPTSAHLVNGSSSIDIPIVNEGDSIGFEGYFLKVRRENFAYRFTVGYVGSNRPTIYQDWQVRIYFDSVPECQNFKVVGITVDSLENSADKLNPEVYFTYGLTNYGGNEALQFNGYYGLGTLQTIPYNAQNGLSITFNWFSSTFTQVYDCIFTVIDYDKLVGTTIDPETGETVNQYSNVSTSNDYSSHVTNYVNNSIVGMSGTDNGAGSFSADWSGTSPDGNFTYDDTFTFNDGGLKSFFTRIWTVGDGFFATALLGVLSIAFAAYLLYGKR